MEINGEMLQQVVSKVVNQLTEDKSIYAPIKVGVSQRHIHLSREHLDILFGKGYELNKLKMLMGGQYAAKETVTIIGTSLKSIEKVRVLGPVRSKTQVEISRTDTFVLKVSPPVRASGDVKGSASLVVVGPKGVVYLDEGCIIANRHIHVCPKDAEKWGLKDNDVVTIANKGDRAVEFKNVQVRVAADFDTEMHIDTDEANSAGLKSGDELYIMGKGGK